MYNYISKKKLNPVKACRMYQKLLQYPKLLKHMRQIFLGTLAEKRIISEEEIRQMALKQVHMSTFGFGSILYRRDHNLLDFGDKMNVLVQKAVGQRYEKYFFLLWRAWDFLTVLMPEHPV